MPRCPSGRARRLDRPYRIDSAQQAHSKAVHLDLLPKISFLTLSPQLWDWFSMSRSSSVFGVSVVVLLDPADLVSGMVHPPVAHSGIFAHSDCTADVSGLPLGPVFVRSDAALRQISPPPLLPQCPCKARARRETTLQT